MDDGISMDGEVSIDGDAEGDAMEASMNGRHRQCSQKTTFSTPLRLRNSD